MSEYTPTTDYSQVVPDSTIPFTHHVRNMYVIGTHTLFSALSKEEREAEFDRWLASYEAELRKKLVKEIKDHINKLIEADENIAYIDGFIDSAIIVEGRK